MSRFAGGRPAPRLGLSDNPLTLCIVYLILVNCQSPGTRKQAAEADPAQEEMYSAQRHSYNEEGAGA